MSWRKATVAPYSSTARSAHLSLRASLRILEYPASIHPKSVGHPLTHIPSSIHPLLIHPLPSSTLLTHPLIHPLHPPTPSPIPSSTLLTPPPHPPGTHPPLFPSTPTPLPTHPLPTDFSRQVVQLIGHGNCIAIAYIHCICVLG